MTTTRTAYEAANEAFAIAWANMEAAQVTAKVVKTEAAALASYDARKAMEAARDALDVAEAAAIEAGDFDEVEEVVDDGQMELAF